MMLPLLNNGHLLYVDNYYSSVELFSYLHNHSTLQMSGTARKNRLPQIAQNAIDVQRRETLADNTPDNPLLCLKFNDKRYVCLHAYYPSQ